MSAKNITIGYVKLKTQKFLSTTINTKNFLDMLSKFVRVVRVPTNSVKYDPRKLKKFNLDYLVVDMMSFSKNQFILREKNNINTPFIIVLRTIEPWLISWLQIIPLINERDIVIAPSQYAKNSFLRISKRLKVHVIPNSLDIKKIQKRISYKIRKTKKTITFMGRLDIEKGIEILIECMPKIISKVGNVHLNIIGPLSGGGIGDYPRFSFVKKLEKKIRKLKLMNNVTFTGLKLGFSKYKILSESDVFILPTTDKAETFGISALEALACGVPVVTSNLECIKHLIKERKNGYLFDVNYDKEGNAQVDRKKLIDSTIKILQDEKLALKMGQKARIMALSYDFRKVIPKLVKLLEKRKTAVRIKNRWEILKDKTIIDFKDLYTDEMQFFINFDRNTHKTYLSIYNEMKKTRLPHPRKRARRIKDVNQKIKNKHQKLIEKIKSELVKYLCIR